MKFKLLRSLANLLAASALAFCGSATASDATVSATVSGSTVNISGSASTTGLAAGNYTAYLQILNASGQTVRSGSTAFSVSTTTGSMTLSTVDAASYYSGMSISNTAPQVCGYYSNPSEVLVAYIGVQSANGAINRYNLLPAPDANGRFCASVVLDAGVSTVLAAYFSNGGQLVWSNNLSLNNASTNVSSGSVRFELTWDQANDIDLHMYTPAAAGGTASLTSYGEHIYFASPDHTWGQLDVDDTSGFGPENITVLSSFPMPGRYLITAHAWALHTYNTNVVVRAYTGAGSMISSPQTAYFTLDDQEYLFGYLNVASNGSYTYEPINTLAGSGGAMMPPRPNYVPRPKR